MTFTDHEERLKEQLRMKIANGETVSNPAELPIELLDLLVTTITTQFNCEEHGGMNYLMCRRLAPDEAERKIMTAIGIEELKHANILARSPLRVLNVNPWEQLVFPVRDQEHILDIFRYPEKFTTWGHFLMFNHLQDRSAAVQLARFKKGPLKLWNDAIAAIERDEEGHIAHGEEGIRALAVTEPGRAMLQKALDDWLPLALAVFGAPDTKSKSLALYQEYNLKDSNDGPREEFKSQIRPLLSECGLYSSLLT